MKTSLSKIVAIMAAIVALCTVEASVFAQTKAIKGTVSDESGNAVIGAYVVSVADNTKGTVTDENGSFTLSVSEGETLAVSCIGYKDTQFKTDARTLYDVIVVADNEFLEETVVIGYGTAKRSDVTGSITSVSSEDLNTIQTGNISSSLQARVAGVEMTQTSSRPGASMQIRIRGTRSLSADNDPLLVLDGIPFYGDLSDLDPTSIKSIDILKDAASTAIYGSRGANGVLLITTNKGYQEQRAQVSYSTYFTLKTVAAKYPMMNGPEFVEMRSHSRSANGLDESDDVNIDWQDLYYKNALMMNHNLTVSGGTSKNNYNFSIGYTDDNAVVPNQNFSRINIRGSLDQQLGEHIKVGFTTNNSYSVSNDSSGSLTSVLQISPIANPYNEDGTMKERVSMYNDTYYVYTRESLANIKDKLIDESNTFSSSNAVYGEVKFPWIKGLTYKVNLGLNFRYNGTGTFTGRGIGSGTSDTPSTASTSNRVTTHWTVENLLTYDRTFNEKHHLNVVAMYSAENQKQTRQTMAGRDIPADYFQYYNIGYALEEITVDPAGQSYQMWGLLSYMGRIMYTYDSRYMVNVALRSDASSRLAKGHQWHTYPAVSFGWNLHNEKFMDAAKPYVDQLKIRAGYGETSNQAVSPYRTLGSLSTRAYNYGEDYDLGYYVSTLPNMELGWEYSSTYNVGVDFSLFKRRLWGTFEYYHQHTHDVLVNMNLPSTTGASRIMANMGETQNKGFELTLNGVLLQKKDWTWTAGLNLYHNDNKILALASGQDQDTSNKWFVGYPISVLYDYVYEGLYQEGDPFITKYESGAAPGDIKVKYTGDYNEDGSPARKINANDRIITPVDPILQGGFNTTVKYKNFDFSLVGAFRIGGKLVSTLYGPQSYLNCLDGRRNNIRVDYWTPENTDARFPRPSGLTNSNNPKYLSTLAVFDATFASVRNITIGYNLPDRVMQKIKMRNIRVYATIQNPFIIYSPFTRETGLYPDTNTSGSAYGNNIYAVGVNTPTTRNYMFGVNISF